MDEKGVWRTIRGRRIFIREGQDLKSAMNESNKFKDVDKKTKRDTIDKFVEKKKSNNKIESLQDKHKKFIKEIEDDSYEENSTYDVNTKKKVEFDKGYQVTFWQKSDNYNDSQYEKKHNEMMKLTSDSNAYVGKFEGTKEISYHFDDLRKAVKIMEKYNQKSIWDWQFKTEIQNQKYEKGKGNDY